MARYKNKKIVKKKIIIKKKPAKRKGKVYEGGTLPPVVIPLPRKAKRKIPKDITKRTPKAVPKRKSAIELERRVQFAKDNPLMPRKPKPRSRRLDPTMLLAPMGGGAAINAAIKLLKKHGLLSSSNSRLAGGFAGSKTAKSAAKSVKKASTALGKRAATGLRGRSASRKKKTR